ncbi:unnamed protein product, partial [marine sediment metagenome]
SLTTDTTGDYVKDVADGTGIDGTATGEGSTYTPTFDATELDAITWSDNANASNAWTFNVSGTDHTMTAGNGLMTFSHDLTISGDDLFMGTNTDKFILVADGTNFNPVESTGDIIIDNTGASALQADVVDNAHINWVDIDNLDDEGTIIVADTTDTTSFVALWESATGSLAAKSDGALLYNAGTGLLTTNRFSASPTDAVMNSLANRIGFFRDTTSGTADGASVVGLFGGLATVINAESGNLALAGLSFSIANAEDV